MTRLFECARIAEEFLQWIRTEKDRLTHRPCLATLLHSPTANEASVLYRNLILKDAARLGLQARSFEAQNEDSLFALIHQINRDPEITGVLTLYPLNLKTPDEDIMDMVSPLKDIEGLHSINLGYLIKYKIFLDPVKKIKCVVPATGKAVVKLLHAYPEIRIKGAFVLIVNNSMRVGKPLGLMLENLGATVIKCYHETPADVLEHSAKRADIVITAVPRADFRLNPDWIRDGAVVVDVSYKGNVDVNALQGKASFVTSPEDRIGQVTRAMMFVNLIYCAQNDMANISSSLL